jgi:hypothetical protein
MGTWIRRATLIAVLATLTAGCGRESSTSVTAPSSRCGVNASAQPASVAAPGGSGAIVVATNRECAWEARSEAEWLSLSTTTGQGDGTVSFAATANPQVVERRGTVAVNGVRVEITQGPAPCVFTLDRIERPIDAGGGRHDVAVSAQNGCSWTAVSHVPWITVAAGATGQGTGVVGVRVEQNDAPTRRTGTLTIAGHTYTVEQSEASAPVPLPPLDPSCTFTVEPGVGQFGSEGGTGELVVTASARTCTWAAVSAAPWIRLEGGAGQTGSGPLRYVVAANGTGSARAGTLIVAGVVVTVTQAAAGVPPAAPCTLTIAPVATSFPADGGASEVAVTASASTCAWTAQPAVGWIAIQGAAGGTGSGRLRFAVAANTTTTARSGTLVVAGFNVTITQAAAAAPPPTNPPPTDPPPTDPPPTDPPPPGPTPCTFSIAPTTGSFAAAGGSADVVVTASASTCTWTATSGSPWIAIQGSGSGTGSGRLTYIVAAQTATSERSGTLTVAGFTVSVVQQAAPAPPPPCTFSIAPNTAAFPAAGGGGEVVVTASASTCTWSASSAAGWIAIQGAAGGTGSGRLAYTVANQADPAERSGTLTVAGFPVTITQAAAPPPPCTCTVAPLELTVALLGAATLEVRVDTTSTCAWTAASQANWITINGTASGTGPGSIRVSVSASLLTGRTGTLVVAGQTVTVTQTGLLGARENRD